MTASKQLFFLSLWLLIHEKLQTKSSILWSAQKLSHFNNFSIFLAHITGHELFYFTLAFKIAFESKSVLMSCIDKSKQRRSPTVLPHNRKRLYFIRSVYSRHTHAGKENTKNRLYTQLLQMRLLTRKMYRPRKLRNNQTNK